MGALSLHSNTMSNDEPLTFLASLPPTDGALKAHGDGGFRLLLDIPDSEAPAFVRLLLYRQMVLRVTVQAEGERPKKLRKKKQADDDGETEDRTGYFAG